MRRETDPLLKPDKEEYEEKNEGGGFMIGTGFKFIVSILVILIFSAIGGILNRIRGGFLTPIPEPSLTDLNSTEQVFLLNIVHRLIFAVPTGLMVGIVCRESKFSDPFYLRRTFMSISIMIAMYFSFFVDDSIYSYIGRGPYTTVLGIFDWLIGHPCSNWDFEQRWPMAIVGMTLRGLVQTVPSGMILFCFGYGVEFLLCGILMGVIYEAAWLLPSNYADIVQGVALGELLWGAFIWFVLILTFLTHRDRPVDSPFSKAILIRILTYISLAIFDLFFIGACVGYSFITDSAIPILRNSNFIGILACTAIFVCVQIVYFIILPLVNDVKKRRMPGVFDDTPYDDTELYGKDWHNISTRVHVQEEEKTGARKFFDHINPSGSQPYLSFLLLVRMANIAAYLVFIPMLMYVVIKDRAMRPCDIPWNQ